MRLTCTNKFRNTNGKIMYYEVKDEHNSYYTVTPQDLKNKLREPGVTCTNLKLTSNGRLISSGSSNMFSKLNINGHERCSSIVMAVRKAVQKNIKVPINPMTTDDSATGYYSFGHLLMIIDPDGTGECHDEYGDEYIVAIDMPLPTNEIDPNLLRNYTIKNGIVQSMYNNNNREMLADLCAIYNTYALKSTDIIGYSIMRVLLDKALMKSVEGLKYISEDEVCEVEAEEGGPCGAEALGGWTCNTWLVDGGLLIKLMSHVWGYEIVVEEEDHPERFRQAMQITRGTLDKKKVTIEMYNFFRRTISNYVRMTNNA